MLALATADLDADVPSCPGWKVVDLLGHVATGWEIFRVVVEAASTERPEFDLVTPTPEDPLEVAAFAAERLALLVPVIASSDPTAPVWTWSGPSNLAFYQRRTHIETVVHRVDVEMATDQLTPVDANVGFDGVVELYATLLAGLGSGLPAGSLHLHQTDGDGELMLDVVDGAISVRYEHGKGDAALRAGGADLLLAMYGRRDLDGLELFGDRTVAEQWIALAP